jgi:hypothetical protein
MKPFRLEETGIFFPAGDVTFLYEVHYIPASQPIYDNSSIRLVFTPHLRPQNATYLYLGANPAGQQMPSIPNNTDFGVLSVRIPASCIFAMQSEEIQEMYLIQNEFHMHGAAIGAAISHERDGKNLPPLGYNPRFDWSSYGRTPPTSRLAIRRGDVVTLHCVYNPLEVCR